MRKHTGKDPRRAHGGRAHGSKCCQGPSRSNRRVAPEVVVWPCSELFANTESSGVKSR